MIILEEYELNFRKGDGELLVGGDHDPIPLYPGIWRAGYILADKKDGTMMWKNILFLYLGSSMSRGDAQTLCAGGGGVIGTVDKKCTAFIGSDAQKFEVHIESGDQVLVHTGSTLDRAPDLVCITRTGPKNNPIHFNIRRRRCRVMAVGLTEVEM